MDNPCFVTLPSPFMASARIQFEIGIDLLDEGLCCDFTFFNRHCVRIGEAQPRDIIRVHVERPNDLIVTSEDFHAICRRERIGLFGTGFFSQIPQCRKRRVARRE